jgi:hypothetical protein
MPKRKQSNITNLGCWAKSNAHPAQGGKENVRALIICKEFTEITDLEWHQQEVPMNDASPPSSPKKKRQKRVAVTVLLNPLHLVMPVEQPPSPLYQNKPGQNDTGMGFFKPPPTAEEAQSAFNDIKRILKPPKKTAGYKDPDLDSVFRQRLEGMKQFLWAYLDHQSSACGKWTMASLLTARALERKPAHSRVLRERTHAFLADREDLPFNIYGTWNESALDKDEELAQEIHLHLQEVGKYVKAMDIVDFLDTPEMRKRTGLTKRIHVATAQRWMKKLEYRWTKDPKGQFVDGHEREDVVAYRQNVFLPAWAAIREKT